MEGHVKVVIQMTEFILIDMYRYIQAYLLQLISFQKNILGAKVK